jgi:hypothetical protein
MIPIPRILVVPKSEVKTWFEPFERECGTLCCRLWRMELCSMWRGALPLSHFAAPEDEELRTASGRAGAAVGASIASRTPDDCPKPLRETLVIPNPFPFDL